MIQAGLTMYVGTTEEWMSLYKNPVISTWEMMMARIMARRLWQEEANEDRR